MVHLLESRKQLQCEGQLSFSGSGSQQISFLIFGLWYLLHVQFVVLESNSSVENWLKYSGKF